MDVTKTRFEVLRTITPHGGIAKTPLELVKRGREIIADEAHWVTGTMFCSSTACPALTAEELADEIMQKGLCGDGWGVCATGAVSLAAGLNAVVLNGYSGTPRVEPLVVESGDVVHADNYFPVEWIGPRPAKVRVERYEKVIAALNDATKQHTLDHTAVWEANDDSNHAEILAIFDTAIKALS